MKHTKRLLTVLLMALLCAVLVLAVSAEGDVTIVASGSCGEWNENTQDYADNVMWTLDSEGTLTISGEGKTDAGNGRQHPWEDSWSKVKHFIVEEGVTEGYGLFESDEYLSIETIKIPASMTQGIKVGFFYSSIFCNCHSLVRIEVAEDNPNYRSDEYGCLYGKYTSRESRNGISFEPGEWQLLKYPECSPWTEFTIPDDITSADFRDFKNLQVLRVPADVKDISFRRRYNSGYGSLRRIEVDENNAFYSSDDSGVLYNKDKTELVYFPPNRDCAFFEIPETVQSLYNSDVFYGCKNLEVLSVSANCMFVPNYPYGEGIGFYFEDCNNLRRFNVHSDNPYYSSNESGLLLNKEGDTLFCYPAGRTDKEFVIPPYITKLAHYSLCRCPNLKKLVIPDTIKEIEDYSLHYLHLDEISVGDNTDFSEYSISDSCFNNCILRKDYRYTGGRMDYYLRKAEEIVVDENNPYCSSEDGVLFNKDKTVLLIYPALKPQTEYTVPSSVKRIESNSFTACPDLKSITFPESLEEIGETAMMACLFTENITVKGMQTAIESSALGTSTFRFNNLSKEDQKSYVRYLCTLDESEFPQSLLEFIEQNPRYFFETYYEEANGEYFYFGTLRCHAGSTAEAYAIENGMDYELVHFYEGDWNYDWDNLIRWRKCIHCDERETEPLETETSGGAEIVAPADDDTGFDVQPVSTDYVLIKETLGEMNVVKAFDITLKNSDGVHVQPKGTVKIKLPNDFKSESYKVYRVNPDGTYTDMNAFREGSHLVFYTDHFSLYVIVDESAPAAPDEPETSAASEEPSKPAGRSSFFSKLFAWLIELFNMLTRWIKK